MRIFDSLHGFIHFNEIESCLIDTEAFQRLHYIHQLGVSYLVYPGARHCRFEHSIGTMHLATNIFDQIIEQIPWQGENADYWRQIVRLAALCHDLGHLPFSHTAESRLLGPKGHEYWTLQILESVELVSLWNLLKDSGRSIEQIQMDIMKIALGKEKLQQLRPSILFSPLEEILAQIISGDFFGADRIDYLLRDARCSGLEYGLFDYRQLIEMLIVIPDPNSQKLTIGVEENGIESCEALLLARHFMQQRLYLYPAIKSYAFHMARFMETQYKNSHYLKNVSDYISLNEPEILHAMKEASLNPADPGHFDAVCFYQKERRFQAIHLPDTTTILELEELKREKAISDPLISWEVSLNNHLKNFLTLPVQKRNKEIVCGSLCSKIIIPSVSKCWLYLSPSYSLN